MDKSQSFFANRAADLILRAGTSLIFIVGGLGHFMQAEVMMERFLSSPWADLVQSIGDPLMMLYLSGGVMLVGGLMLMVGAFTRWASLALFVALVPITFVIHIAPDHVGPLLKNVAILSALFFIYVKGPGAYAVDNHLSKQARRY